MLRCGLLLLCAGARAGEPAAGALHDLMQSLAGRQHGHASYSERQFISVLDKPLESSGELFFDAPDRLEKRTLVPKAETVVLEKDTVTIRRGSRSKTLSLRNYPQFGPIIEAMRAAVMGDLAALERHYIVAFEQGAGRWTMTMTPREKALAAEITGIRVAGAGTSIDEIEIDRVNGDRSVMTIRPLPEN